MTGTSPAHPSFGRFAPSSTGPLHLGNLRTALASWLLATTSGRSWLVRMEDLDRVTSSAERAAHQLADLAALGLHSDLAVVAQSARFDRYRAAIGELDRRGLVYECFCTRAEIRQAASAPHGAPARYPGTCRRLDAGQRAARRAVGRPAALRLRAGSDAVTVSDRRCGTLHEVPDDIVLQRNDGVPAYHLAVVVDDAEQGVTQVVRGDDLWPSTPSQVHLQGLLGLPTPEYVHLPLAVGADGTRLAKRHGSVTLGELADHGWSARQVLAMLARSLGIGAAGDGERTGPVERADLVELAARFDLDAVPGGPWVVPRDGR